MDLGELFIQYGRYEIHISGHAPILAAKFP